MKSLKKISAGLKSFIAVVMLSLLQTIAFAQDKKVDININTDKGGNWYAQPWVWLVGGPVFLLLLVALLRGNNNKN